MRQKKMEAYKNAKKNKKELEKQAKKKRIISWICGIVIALLIVGGCGYLVYYTNVVLPKKQSEQSTTSENFLEDIANNIMDILNNSEATASTDATDSTDTVSDTASDENATDTASDTASDENAADAASDSAE